jgi:hypothetical protein
MVCKQQPVYIRNNPLNDSISLIQLLVLEIANIKQNKAFKVQKLTMLGV